MKQAYSLTGHPKTAYQPLSGTMIAEASRTNRCKPDSVLSTNQLSLVVYMVMNFRQKVKKNFF